MEAGTDANIRVGPGAEGTPYLVTGIDVEGNRKAANAALGGRG